MPTINRADIQASILEGYRAQHVRHYFLRFIPGRERSVLSELKQQVSTAQRWRRERPSSLCNLGVSFAGLAQCDIDDHTLRHLPLSFREGMRARNEMLGDRLENFDEAFLQPLHLWLWIQAHSEAALEERSEQLQAVLQQTELVRKIDGSALADENGNPTEHFGFRDGLSQPRIEGSLASPQIGNGVLHPRHGFRPLATGEFLLGHADETGVVPHGGATHSLCQNGTFAVFRKLEQHVRIHLDYIAQESQRLQAAGIREASADWLAERMVGRRKDGTPLAATQMGAMSFAEDRDGRVCPLGAHVRRAHPRDGRAFGGSFSRHRILRRGMPYGPRFSEQDATSERGLLFVALNADIERQFEFLQQRYMNDGAAVRQGYDADPLLSAERGNFVIPGDMRSRRDTVICTNIPTFVTCRGGEYFLLPSLSGVQWILDQMASNSERHSGLRQALTSALAASDAAACGEESHP